MTSALLVRYSFDDSISRLQRFFRSHFDAHLGRCPRLLHFAPLALVRRLLQQSREPA